MPRSRSDSDATAGRTMVLGDSARIHGGANVASLYTPTKSSSNNNNNNNNPSSQPQRSSLPDNNNNNNPIQPNRTFESNGTCSDESAYSGSPSRKRPLPTICTLDDDDVNVTCPPPETTASTSKASASSNPKKTATLSQKQQNDLDDEEEEEWAACRIYIALFAVFGAVLRIYLGRLFGLDCEFHNDSNNNNNNASVVNDFLTPAFAQICVTASGKTSQTGGALFTDLPANMLGCLLVGIFTPTVQDHPLAWFGPDHPLQRHVPFRTAIVVGLAGSLTTFASWNTQMIVMLDGTFTELGPQVASALIGYLVGVGCAVSSFLLGRHVHDWLRERHEHCILVQSVDDEELGQHQTVDHADVEQQGTWLEPSMSDATSSQRHEDEDSFACRCGCLRQCIKAVFGIRFGPLLLALLLLGAFVVGDVHANIMFYRRMWMTVLVAPVGALMRWKLHRQWNNSMSSSSSEQQQPQFPVGTVAANVMACILSAMLEGVDARLIHGSNADAWVLQLLLALEVGFAGSLSTVSTMVKEMFVLASSSSPARAHAYCFGTIAASMLLGLAVYSPIVRTA